MDHHSHNDDSAFRHNVQLTGRLQMEIISSTWVDETSVTGFMHTSLSAIVGTGLAVVGPAEVTP